MITDNRARIQYANPALTRLTGYAPLEVIGQNPRILNSSRQPRRYCEELWKTIRGGRIWRGRLINRRKDGTLYNEEMTIAPVRNASGAVTNFVAIKQDVTERATKEELSSFLASLVESSGDSIIGCTPGGKILTWNHAAELLYGYPAEEAIGNPLYILVPTDLVNQLGLMLERVKCGERIASFDTALVSKDKRLINVSVTIAPIKNSPGTVTGTVVITRDITEKKLAEEALTERARLATLDAEIGRALNGEGTLRQGLQLCTEALVQHLNAAFARVWTLNETTQVLELEASAGIYTHIDGAHARVPIGKFKIGRIAKECKPHLTNDVLTDDWLSDPAWAKQQGMVSFAGYPLVLAGRTIGVIAIFARQPLSKAVTQDLASVASRIAQFVKRKRSDEALRVSEEHFRQLAENIQEVFFIHEPGRPGLVYLSPAYEEVWGRPREEAYARADAWIDAVHAEDRDQTIAFLARANGGERGAAEYRIVRPDGSVRFMRAKVFPVFDTEGKLRRVVGIAEDITDNKRGEQAILAAKDAAEAASRAKSDFLANMSHEIRTPMNAVIGLTEIVLDTDLSHQQRSDLNAVRESAHSLLNVINDILDFSKIEARKLSLEFVQFSLHDSVDSAIRSLSLQAAKKNLELICHYQPDVPDLVQGDPGRLRQILVNLIGNAIKFTPRGVVAVDVEKKQITTNEVLLHFTVSDTGIGIPPEKQKTIFEAFTQADTSSTRHFGGTGLGLTISSELVKMMGGRIWVETEINKGSIFHFEVRLGVVETAAARSVPSDIACLQGMAVLVVDDNPINRRILAEIFRRWRMTPTLTSGGAEALAAMKKARAAGQPFPLVIVDAQMTDMDGLTLVESIKLDPLLADAIAIMLTSSGQPGDATRCLELGAAAYLTKPILEPDLQQAILQVLGKAEPTEPPLLVPRHSLPKAHKMLQVLVAEDNVVNQLLAKRLIEKQGHSTVVAATGREALEAIEKGTIDLVLMDVQMPDMDGLSATAIIRQHERLTGGHLPIIAMTARAMHGDKQLCLEAGMDAYVSKPISADELYQTIESVLTPVDRQDIRIINKLQCEIQYADS